VAAFERYTPKRVQIKYLLNFGESIFDSPSFAFLINVNRLQTYDFLEVSAHFSASLIFS